MGAKGKQDALNWHSDFFVVRSSVVKCIERTSRAWKEFNINILKPDKGTICKQGEVSWVLNVNNQVWKDQTITERASV